MKIMTELTHYGVFSITFFIIKLAHCDIGGYDLFASNMQLKILWENDIELVKLLESIQEKWKNSPKCFDM